MKNIETHASKLRSEAPPSQTCMDDSTRRLSELAETEPLRLRLPCLALRARRRGCERFILLPSSMKRMAWDLIGMVLLVYDMVVIPITAFEPEAAMSGAQVESAR